MINVDANVKNWLIKVYAIKNMLGILVIVVKNDECECDKSCDFGEYLDYENCKCRKRLVDKLIEECNENIEETSLIKINSTKCKSNSCILYIVLFSIFFTINIGIATYFIYYKYINHNKENVSVYDYVYHAKNY